MKSSVRTITTLSAAILVAGVFASRPPCAAKATPSGSQPQPAVAPAEKKKEARRLPLQGFEVHLAAGKGTRATAGASRGGGDDEPLTLLAPERGLLLGLCPLFEWRADGDGPYRLEIQDETGNLVVHESVRHPSYSPTGGTELFEPGKHYTWQVILSVPGDPPTRSSFAYFEVPKLERSEFEKNPSSQPSSESFETLLAKARMFRDKGIWYDAIGAYAQLINRFPERPEVYDERGQIYLQLKPTRPLAEKDFKTADGLRAKR